MAEETGLLQQEIANRPVPNPGKSPLSEAIGREFPQPTGVENPIGFGTEAATEEENQQLAVVLDGIEQQIHGVARDDLVDLLNTTPELFMSVAQGATSLLQAANIQLAEQGVDLGPEFWFGENGIIQSTVEMVYELAVASDAPNADDTNQLDLAFMKTMQMVGEDLFENDDPSAVEAQQLLIDMEFGEGASDIAAEGFELAQESGDLPPPQAAGAEGEEAALLSDPLAGLNGA